MAHGRLEARITVPSGGWTMTIDENAGARSATVTIATFGSEYYLSSPGTVADTDLLKEIGDKLTANATLAGTYTASLSTTTGKVTISSDADDFAITWPEASLRDLLGWDANISESAATYTSDHHAESLWLPDGDWVTEFGDIAGWWESDKHDVESSSGYGWSYAGSKKRLNRIFWPAISRARTLAAKESDENESFEVFWRDGIYGEQEWATVGGPIRWYPDTSAVDDTVYFTYRCHGLENFRPGQLQENWVGKYQIELPRLVQVPGEYPGVGVSAPSSSPTTIAELLAHSDPAQALIDIMGHDTKPTHFWRFDVASGATDLIAAANLADVNSPTKEVDVSAAFGAGAKATRFTDGSTESCDAASSAAGDVADESMALIVFLKFHGASAGFRSVITKREFLNAGWVVQTPSGGTHLAVSWENASGTSTTHTIAINHGTANPVCLLMLNDHNANLSGAYTGEGSTTGAARTGSLSNSAVLTAGDYPSARAGNVDLVAAVEWIGVGAEGITNAMRLAVAQQLGLES